MAGGMSRCLMLISAVAAFQWELEAPSPDPYGADGMITLKKDMVNIGETGPILVTNNFSTRDEFRLTFDMFPTENATAWSSVFRITNYTKNSTGDETHNEGTPGDRIPGFIMEPGGTGMHVYMGADLEDNPNAANVQCKCNKKNSDECPMPKVGETSQILLRLLGDTMAMYVNRELACISQVFHDRYSSDGGCYVWLGDEYWPTAPIKIGNVVYASLQSPGSKNLVDTDPVTTAEVRGTDQLLLNISMALKMEMDRIVEEVEAVQTNLTECDEKIGLFKASEEFYQDRLINAVHKTQASKYAMVGIAKELQAHEDALVQAKTRMAEDVDAIQSEIKVLAPQLASMEDVLEVFASNADMMKAGAQIVGMFKQMAWDQEKALKELHVELPELISRMQEVVDKTQAALEASEKEYEIEAMRYITHNAEEGKLRGLDAAQKRVHKYWTSGEEGVSIGLILSKQVLGWIPTMEGYVNKKVEWGRYMVQGRVLERFKDNETLGGPSPHRHDILGNESDDTAIFSIREDPVGEDAIEVAHAIRDDAFLQVSHKMRRSLLRRHIVPAIAVIHPKPRLLRRPALAVTNQSIIARHRVNYSEPFSALLRKASADMGSDSVELAAGLVERSAQRVGSQALHRLAAAVRTSTASEGTVMLRQLQKQLLKKEEEEQSEEQEARKACLLRLRTGLAERKASRHRLHELRMKNASAGAYVAELESRIVISKRHLNFSAQFIEFAPDVEMTRPLKNTSLRKYMMQDVADIRKGLHRWTVWHSATPATIAGVNKTTYLITESIRQVQDEAREDIDKLDDDLKRMRREMKATIETEERAIVLLEEKMPEGLAVIDDLKPKLMEEVATEFDARHKVGDAERECGSYDKIAEEAKKSSRDEEESTVKAAVDLLSGGNHGRV